MMNNSDAPTLEIDLNCDAGESYGPWPMGDDAALIPLMTSVNIACGAHPGYPDLHGFGRRAIPMPPDEVEAWTLAQLGALAAMAQGVGVSLKHVKPHGALYNTAADDEATAEAIVQAVRAFDPELALVARAGSPMVAVARACGLRVAEEAFADRGYDATGRLLPRSHPDALLSIPEEAAQRAVTLIQTGELRTNDGARLHLNPQTLCVHSDTLGAAAIAAAVRAALLEADVTLRPLYELAS